MQKREKRKETKPIIKHVNSGCLCGLCGKKRLILCYLRTLCDWVGERMRGRDEPFHR